MPPFTETLIRPALESRRHKLEHALTAAPGRGELLELLDQVDAALHRLDDGTYGLCAVCHEAVEPERLIADPLECFCLDHLTREQQRALQDDLETAARVQRSLLPPESLKAGPWQLHTHWDPAGPVSGDFCDILRPEDPAGGLLVLLGDVAGKGVSAALLMAHLHATFRSLATGGLSVADMVTRAGRVFRESTLAHTFATLVCVRIADDGTGEVCNAGHWPPLLLGAAGVTAIDPTGLPVGTFLSSTYTSTRIRLDPGDTLLLYTDGVIEARDGGGSEYGSDRLAALLDGCRGASSDAVAAAVAADVAAHRGAAPRTDDLTLMVVRREV